MIVLNEVKEAEKILNNGEVGVKPSATLFLLAKYYKHKCKFTKKLIQCHLHNFMEQNYPGYNPALWEDMIENIATKSQKYDLREIDFVGISEYEINKIKSIKNDKYEKLLFSMLCYAKLYNLSSENNNDWVNTPIKEIFKSARVIVKRKEDKFLILNDLEKTGLISFSSKNDNLNLKINFIDQGNDYVLKIRDFRELSYEYLNFLGNGNFIRCKTCEKLCKAPIKNNRIYCSECSTYQLVGTKIIACVDCGKDVEVDASSRTIRCDICFKTERRRIEREKKRKQRQSH